MNTLIIYRGKVHIFTMTFTDEDNQPVPLTGKTIRFMAKKKETDDDADAILSKSTTSPPGGITITDAVNGKAELTIDDADTSGLQDKALKLYYSVDVLDASGPRVADVGRVEIKVAVIKATT